MKCMGLDLASRSGCVVLVPTNNKPLFAEEVVPILQDPNLQRAKQIAERIRQILVEWKPDMVVVEGYGLGVNRRTTIVLVEIGTTVRLVLSGLGMEWWEFRPTAVKKFMGHGGLKKKQMMERVKKEYGYSSLTDNIADAYVLSKMGLAMTGHEKALRLGQREVLGQAARGG
jgi:Holliday junction resolvasome RuvABC endonuclease subunit